MNVFERISRWLATPPAPTPQEKLQGATIAGRQASYSEKYDQALTHFQEAEALAQAEHDLTALADARLNMADMLIHMGRYDEAETLLEDLRQISENRRHRGPLAYALCSLGWLAQQRSDWAKSRACLEEAQDIARRVQAQGAEGRANGHLADVYLHEGNASYALHLLQQALSQLEQSGDTELTAYFYGRQAEAFRLSEQSELCRQALRRGLIVAASLRHVRYIRVLSTQMANLEFELGAYRPALKHYDDAHRLFFDHVEDVPAVLHLQIQLARCHLKLSQVDRAHTHIALALAVAQDCDDASLNWRVRAVDAMVQARQDSTHATQPLKALAEDAQCGQDIALCLDIHEALALVYEANNAMSSAIDILSRAVTVADTPATRPQKAQAQFALGTAYEAQQHYEQALDTWSQARVLFDDLGYAHQAARLACDMAHLRTRLGEGRRAARDIDDALERLSSIDDVRTRGIILANAAVAYSEFGDLESAEAFFQEAIQIAQQTSDTQAEATRKGNYSRFLTQINDPKPALTGAMEALALARRAGASDVIAVQLHNIGYAYEALGQTDNAIQHYQDALATLAGVPDSGYWQAAIRTSLANTLTRAGKPGEAQSLYARALEAALADPQVPLQAQIRLGLGRLAMLEDQLARAQEELDQALALANRCQLRRVVALAQATLSQLYAAQGDHTTAHETWQAAEKLLRQLRILPPSPDWLTQP